MRVAKQIQLSSDDDRRLRILSKLKRVEARVQMRSRIVLLAADGMTDKDIAQKLDTDRRVAARWRARFLAAGVEGLFQDATRSGRPRTARKPANVEQVVRITLEETPEGATHWSTRTLAAHLGTSASAVACIWRAHGLKPHRVESFKLSNDPCFIEKLEDMLSSIFIEAAMPRIATTTPEQIRTTILTMLPEAHESKPVTSQCSMLFFRRKKKRSQSQRQKYQTATC